MVVCVPRSYGAVDLLPNNPGDKGVVGPTGAISACSDACWFIDVSIIRLLSIKPLSIFFVIMAL